MKSTKLTNREWELFVLLRKSDNGWSLKSILDLLPNYFKADHYTNNKPYCRHLTYAIDLINESTEVDKIIIYKNGLYKLATEDEARDYVNKLNIKWKKQVIREQKIMLKINRDQQGKLLSNQNKPIDASSKAKEFHETYVGNN